MLDDTIAAVATPPGRGAIGIVRLSGSDAVPIARSFLAGIRGDFLSEPRRPQLADVVTEPGRGPIDRALVTFFRAPHSYTGEDVVEVACHGSPVVLEHALAAAFSAGARAATPGEFTLRAFLNGRLDLVQAEAVRDLVDAQTSHQARVARRQLGGALSLSLVPLKERLLDLVVQLESSIEFVEDDLPQASREALGAELRATALRLREMAGSYSVGRLLARGVALAIIGPPNAGKSSIFNHLLGRSRSIVTALPGTTRDLVSETVVLSDVAFRLVDTAGIRPTDDPVERIGVELSRTALADADVVLLVLDAAETSADEAMRLLAETSRHSRVVALNKCDVADTARLARLVPGDGAYVPTSAQTGDNMESLQNALVAAALGEDHRFGQLDVFVTNARQHAHLRRASESLDRATEVFEGGLSEEIALVGIHDSLRALGDLTGATAVNDILHRIFDTFCIGK